MGTPKMNDSMKTFLYGAGSVVDLFGTRFSGIEGGDELRQRYRDIYEKDDAQAIRSDWEVIGSDFDAVLGKRR